MESLAGKKIGLAITKSNWGGAQAYVYTLAKAFVEAGADVFVIAGGRGMPDEESGILFEKLAEAGVRTIFLPDLMRDISIIKEFKSFAHLVLLLRRERPHVLHLNSSKMGGLGALAGRLAGVRHIVFTAHGWAHREDRSAFARALIRLASFATVVLANRVIVVSKRDRDDAPAPLMQRKLLLIHNGIEPFPLLTREEARTALSLPTNEVVLLIIAELHPNKGIDIAIRALADLHGRFPHLSIACVGHGSEMQNLSELAGSLGVKDRVHFLGFIPDARSYLRAADLILMPSLKEGFPFALLEAGIASLPVIASRTGGIPEIIRDGLTGALVPPGNVSALAETLSFLISDAPSRTRLGTALGQHVRERFSEEAMLEGTLRAYS